VPVAVGLMRFRHLSTVLKTFSIFIFLAAVFEAIATYMAINSINNHFVGHVYTIIEFFFLGLLFYAVFERAALKKTIIVLIIGFTVFAVINAIYFQSIYTFLGYALATYS